MLNKLRQMAANMVISDQFLDIEEETLFLDYATGMGVSQDVSEAILREVLEEFQAIREKQLVLELENYLKGPLLEGFLREDEEKRALSFLIRKTAHLSLERARTMLTAVCQSRNMVTEIVVRESLRHYIQNQVKHTLIVQDVHEEIFQWVKKEYFIPDEEAERMVEEICLEYGW